MKSRRLILVSNRLSISIESLPGGGFSFQPSIGGLATGLSSIIKSKEILWVGWSGIMEEELSHKETIELEKRLLREYHSVPVSLGAEHLRYYYEGFSNNTLWPLFHYFPSYVEYDPRGWTTYREVNERFLEKVRKIGRDGDTIWVHDYQLMLLPALLRREFPNARIGFFLHIPFPSYELFKLLPWRRELLEGVLGADLVGFHTYDYARHFLSATRRILGYDHHLGTIFKETGGTRVDVFPMGIDVDRMHTLAQSEPISQATAKLRQEYKNRQIILSVDRLDYTKGIPFKLSCYEQLLDKRLDLREHIVLILIVAPSRVGVPQYQALKQEIDERVGSINGRYGSIGWEPIRYFFRSYPQEELIALYKASDVLLVTPLRDGMNLIAKEYIACRREEGGALVLSENAGAAFELIESFIVNPNNIEEIVNALEAALATPVEEQKQKMTQMQKRIETYTLPVWINDFLEHLENIHTQQNAESRTFTPTLRKKLVERYRTSNQRLFLLDYDGTLFPIVRVPEKAVPDPDLLDTLRDLSNDPKNTVVIVSGREKEFLQTHLGDLHVGLIAGHGVWVRPVEGPWHLMVSERLEWKEVVLPIMEWFARRTPGSFIEQKGFSVAWHYRQVEPDLALIRLSELKEALTEFINNYQLSILEGNRVLEVKPSEIHKGLSAGYWLGMKEWDFIFAAGDDLTDEDLFLAIPKGYTVKVGSGTSFARYRVHTPQEVRALLKTFLAARL